MRVTVPITVSAGGTATAYSGAVSGLLEAIYVELGTLAAGAVDFTITEEFSGAPIVTLTNVAASTRYLIRNQVADATGGAIAGEYAPVPIRGRIKIVVAGGGNATSGKVHLYVRGATADAEAGMTRALTTNL